MKLQRYQQFIESYKHFNERYSRTVGFRYSEPTIKFDLEVESTDRIDHKKVVEFFKNKRVKNDINIIDDSYMTVAIYVYNEKEINTIIDQMIQEFSLKTDRIHLSKSN